MILLPRSPSSRAAWSPSPAPPLALPNRSICRRRSFVGFSHFSQSVAVRRIRRTQLSSFFLAYIGRARCRSVVQGKGYLVPRSQPGASITRMYF
jgi:hypothetical protein